jgi:dipeptidyl aminopeptidase/acylaminoacyl peptidase
MFDLPPRETAGGSGHLLEVTAVAVSPDGTRAATTGKDQTIKLWDLATGKELATLVGNAEVPLSLVFLGNDAVVLGVQKQSRDSGMLQFWATGTGRKLREEAVGEPYTLAGSADGTRLAVATQRVRDGAAAKMTEYRLYDADGKLLSSVAEQDREVKAVAFSADLSWAVTGDAGGHIRIWDVAKKDKLGADWPLPTFPVVDLGLTPDKKLLVVAGGKEGLVLVADVAKRTTLKELAGKPGPVTGLVVSPTGDTFVTLGADRVVRVWSLADPREPAEVRAWPLPVAVRAAAYTPDGKRLVTGNADGTAYVLELP